MTACLPALRSVPAASPVPSATPSGVARPRVDTFHARSLAMLQPRWPTPASPPPPVALLLNGNARQVKPAMVKQLGEVVGVEHVYYSRSLAEARNIAATIVQRGYPLVVSGGGDGTFVTTINLIREMAHEQAQRSGQPVRMPAFGLLTLGTGNALDTVVGASQPLADLQKITQGQGTPLQMQLIEDGDTGNGERFFFAGVGYNAQVLHDYNKLRSWFPRGVMRNLVTSPVGYAAAVALRTIPRALFGKGKPMATIVTRGPAFYVNPKEKDTPVPIPPNTQLYHGPVGLLDVGTVPDLGSHITMFPFYNRMPHTMQLRVSPMSMARSLLHVRGIWRGTYRNPKKLYDYLVTDVEVLLDRPVVYQHSGEEGNKRDVLRFRCDPQVLRAVAQNAHGEK